MTDALDEALEAEDPKEETEEEPTKDEPKPEDKGEEEISETPSLEDRLSSLENENKGFLKTIAAERDKRQTYERQLGETEGKYKALLDTINQQIETRKAKVEEEEPPPEPIKVLYDDDGNPILPVDIIQKAVDERVKPLQDELKQTKGKLAQAQSARDAKTAFEQARDSVVGEKAEYSDAYAKLEKPFSWLMQRTGQHLMAEKINLPKGTPDRS